MEKKKVKKDILHWLGCADEDYLAARLLILNGYLKQGVILCNTSIEKYLKVLIFFSGKKISKTHNTNKLLEEAKVGFPKIKIVNEGFISFLSKGYQLRYTDDLPSGYNIHLDQIKILAEQDRTVYSIRDNLKFETLDGKKIATRIDFFIEQKDQVLLDKNISFGNTDPAGLFKEKSSCLSLLVYGDHNIIEGIGEIDGTVDDGKFDVVGIKQGQ